MIATTLEIRRFIFPFWAFVSFISTRFLFVPRTIYKINDASLNGENCFETLGLLGHFRLSVGQKSDMSQLKIPPIPSHATSIH